MSKRKRKNKQTKYNKKTFKNTVCSNCGLCESNATPDFCYTFYKDDPERFMSYIFRKLTALHHWPQTFGVYISDIENDLFKQIFCESNICDNDIKEGEECPSLNNCIFEHRKQIYLNGFDAYGFPRNQSTPFITGKKGKKRKKKEKYIAKPYPTFFCNSTETEKEVKEIIEGP